MNDKLKSKDNGSGSIDKQLLANINSRFRILEIKDNGYVKRKNQKFGALEIVRNQNNKLADKDIDRNRQKS